MPLVSPIIEKAASYVPDSLYLRATDEQANIEADALDLEGRTVIIYNNLPTVKNRTRDGGVLREWPAEIRILQLAEADDDDRDGDVIRAELLPVADLIFDACLKDNRVSNLNYAQNYDIDFLNAVKVYDDILTGLVIKFPMYFDRTLFCVPDEPAEPTP